MEILGKGFVIAALATVNLFSWSFVATSAWQWFVVPLGVPSITQWHALGLSTTVALCFMHQQGNVARLHAKLVDGGELVAFLELLGRGFHHLLAIWLGYSFLAFFKWGMQ